MSYILVLLVFITGFVLGGFLFSDSRRRNLLNSSSCRYCLSKKELSGLLGSVIVQKIPRLLPGIVLETDKTVVFQHPRPKHRIHYMFVPKKDIKNIGELSAEDGEYIIDMFSTVVSTIKNIGTDNYRVWTNGPGKQDVSYLHFHLGAD